jgi:serine/threonine protein kinase
MKECPVCRRCFPDHVNHCPDDGDATTTSISGEPVLDGRYQLERRLGHGGMGVVYQARHIFLKTAHAIKVILPDLVGNDPMLVTRFRQEALAAAAIRHQNIIAVTDFGVVRGTMPFLVMEFVSGKSLHDILAEEGALPPARALEVISAVGAGVAAAHRQGIVHRDLKPLNIMLQESMPIAEAVKVLDFGLAKIKSGELLGSFIQAKTSGLMGSPFYMAPEQWGDEEPDARADIYSLGVILFQMLGGDVPFKGTSIPSIMKKHLTLSPPTFASMGIQVPPQIEGVVRHALEKEAENRPASVEDFIGELRDAVTSLTASLKQTSLGISTAQAQTIITSAPSHGSVSIPPATTTLRIRTRPPRSRVYVNNVSVGVTNDAGELVVREMLRGVHRVHVIHDNYQEWSRQIECETDVCDIEAQLKDLSQPDMPQASVIAHQSFNDQFGGTTGSTSLNDESTAYQSHAAMEAQRLRQQADALEEQARREEAEQRERLEREERERIAREEAEREEAERLEKEERERVEREEAKRQEQLRLEAEAQRREAEAAEAARLKAEEESRLKAEEEAARLKAEAQAEAQRQAEEEAARLRAEEEARVRAEEEERQRAEEARLAAEAEAAKRRAEEEERRLEEEKRLAAEAEARRQAEEEARLRAEEERKQAEEEARRKAEEERLRVEEEKRLAAEAAAAEEARLRAEEEARLAAEAEAQRKAEEEAEARRLAEEEARLAAEAEAEALRKAEEEREAARLLAEEEEARLRAEAEAEAQRKADEEVARQLAEENARELAAEEAAAALQAEAISPVEHEVAEPKPVEASSGSEWVEVDIAEPEAVHHAEPMEASMEEAVSAESEVSSEPVILEPLLETPAVVGEPVAGASASKEIEYAVTEKGVDIFDENTTVPRAILRRLSSEEPDERASAVIDLARVGGDDSFREINAAFDDPAVEVRNAAARSLFNVHTDRAATFTRALREAPPERRRKIGAALASSGLAGEAIGQLMGESREKTYDAFSLLFLMSKAGEVQPLMRAIEEHPNNEVRLAVIKLLALSGQQEILPAFRRLAVRGSLPTEVRSAVMEAIYQLSSQSPTAA